MMSQSSGKELSDAQAVRMVLDGRTEVFGVLVRRHQDALFALLRRHLPPSEVAEVAQDAFVHAFEKLHQLRDGGAFKSWLCSLAVRRAIHYWRGVGTRKETSLDGVGPDGEAWLDSMLAQDSMDRHDDAQRKREAASLAGWLLGFVKPEDRIALGLYYAGEHELTEIGAMMGWSVEKVKVRLHRARKLMADVMDRAAKEGGVQHGPGRADEAR